MSRMGDEILIELTENLEKHAEVVEQRDDVTQPKNDYTGVIVGKRQITGFAGRDERNKPRWDYKCTLCGTPGKKPATYENLRSIERRAKDNGTQGYCINCPELQDKAWNIIPNGTESNSLVVIGPCFLDRTKTSPGHRFGTRFIPTRCTLCGKEEPKDKGNFASGRANCSCESQVALGLSNTPIGRMFHAAQARSRTEGWEIDITIHDLIELGIPNRCPCLGIPLNKEIKKRSANSPALDRIDNSKGYIKDNIWIISDRANRLKNDGTADELMKIATAVAQRMSLQKATLEH